MTSIEFGVRMPVAGPLANRENIRRAALAAEQMDFDCLWMHDFVVWTEHLDMAHISCGSLEAVEVAKEAGTYRPNFYDSLSTMAFLAGATERIRLGVAVLCLPFRQPVTAAKQVASIDQLSGGRVTLGVGVGAAATTGNKDFEVLGVPREGRYGRTVEYLKAMQEIWHSDAPEFHGKYVDFDPTSLNPKPVQAEMPVWFGGAGPKALEMTGTLGNGWIPGRLAIDQYPGKVAQIQQHAADVGRGDVNFTIASEIYACIGETEQTARADSAKTIEALNSIGGFPQLEAQQAFADHALIGGPQEVVDKVGRMVDVGVTHFEMKFIYRDVNHLLEQLEQFRADVSNKFQ